MSQQSEFNLFSTSAMSAAFSPQAHVQTMLDFEAALAQAEAKAGVIPAKAAQAIVATCQTAQFEIKVLFEEAARAGTLVIPLVRMLTAQLEGEAKKYVHWGATSQDVIDTALMLQMQQGLGLLEADLMAIGAACAKLAEQHRTTLMAGRTLLQQALPITFGLKAARWLGLATRQVGALRQRQAQSLALQLGGAAGTLAALGDKGPEVANLLAQALKLPLPDLPWHTERDRVAEIAATLGIIAGAMSKIAGDIALLAQTEVGEASESAGSGKGGSSAMPQKRNPVDVTLSLAASRLAIGLVPVILTGMGQEHERAVGGWQAEWAAIPELFGYTAKAVAGVRSALEGLEIDQDRMQRNLAMTEGLVMAESLTMALAAKIGRPEAFKLVETLTRRVGESRQNLSKVAEEDEQVQATLTPAELEKALDPAQYLGSSSIFIDRALSSYYQLQKHPYP